ncbi:MAG: hypothetical protein JF886_14610, partial [Candidatus Dormibacteraeota bacterium]|nr:hypothetical protein [Candidatus Dormibacteraeota bacterium]
VLLLTRYGSGAATVGAMWAVMGVTGIIAGALAGRMDSEGREVWFIAVGAAVSVVAMGCMLVAATVGGGVPMVAAGMAVFGIANGPFDIGLFSLRQRATAPAWMGRAFAVSMSLNFVGLPVGSALAGPIVDHSAGAAFALALSASALGGVAAVALLRPVRQRRVSGAEYN